MTFEEMQTAKAAAFPHAVKAHLSHRCTAGSFLARQGIRKGKDYRRINGKYIPKITKSFAEVAIDTFIFRLEDHAIAFRMWLPTNNNEKATHNLGKVILPVIRNVMANVIAADIIGVQPMTGPAGQIFTLRKRYG